MPASPALLRLQLSMDTPDTRWLEDFDLDALRQLEGAERATATEWLLERLDKGRDLRAARALGVQATPAALEGLSRIGCRDFDEAHLESLLALEPHTPGLLTAQVLQPFFERVQEPVRLKVAYALRRVSGEDALLTLELGLYDPTALVRINAASSLIKHHRVEAWESNPGSTLSHLTRKLSLPYRACWQPAAQQLGGIFASLREGKTPEALGLDAKGLAFTPTRMKVVSSLRTPPGVAPWAEQLDVTSLLALSGFERELTVDTLLGALERGDYRAPAALVASEDPRIPAVLAEAFTGASGRLQLELAVALLGYGAHGEALRCVERAAASEDPVIRARVEQGLRAAIMHRPQD